MTKFKKFIIIIFILAFLVRLIYVINVPYQEYQHDVEPNGNGLAYIFTILETGKLPESNAGQFYHPPLHQIISAVWIKVVSIFTNNFEIQCESLQFLTLIYSMIILFLSYKILEILKLKDKYKILAMIVFAFHPMFIILSGALNNDVLCLMFVTWSILRLIKWYYKPDIKNITILAIVIGLSVMTKTSGGIIAIPTIYIFLLRMFKDIKRTNKKTIMFKKYFYLFIFFGCIALPIGLWYPIRNYMKFGQPILYVMDVNNADLYVGDNSLLSRFGILSSEMFKMYCDPWVDFNIPTFLVKCSLFEEFTWGVNFKIIYFIAIIANMLAIITFIYMFISTLINPEKRNKQWIISLGILFLFNLLSYVMMNLKLPYGCTMNFRYLLPSILIGALFVSFGLDYYRRKKPKLEKVLYLFVIIITVILVLLSDIIILFS